MKHLTISLALCTFVGAALPASAQKTMAESNLLTGAAVSVENATVNDSALLCDGNDATVATISSTEASIICRFPSAVTVGAVNVVAGADLAAAPTKILIYARNSDEAAWSPFGRGTSLGITLPFTNNVVRAQNNTAFTQYRIELTGASAPMQLAEVQLLGYDPTLDILSTPANGAYSTADGPADYDGYGGSLTVKKTPSNLGISGDNSWHGWLRYDFDTPTAISGYTLGGKSYSARKSVPSVWELQASDDGQEWVTLDMRANAFNADGENYATTYLPGKSGISMNFADIADDIYRMVDNKFYRPYGNGHYLMAFWNTDHTKHDPAYNYWWMAHAVDAYTDAYRRNQSRSFGYNNRATSIKTGMYTAYGGSYDLWNSYYDDMEWMCIACLHASEVFTASSGTWLGEARQLFDWIWAGWDETTGGILWNNGSQRGTVDSKNSCSNGPAMIAAALLYRLTGETEYFEKAKMIFDFMLAHNLFDDGFVKDSPSNDNRGWTFTYNQGTWVGGLLELYRITGEQKYHDIAVDLMDKCLGSSWYSPKGILIEGGEFGDGDGGMFKGIFVRYLTEWVLSGLLDDERQLRYASYLVENARSLVNAALLKPDLTVMANWQDRGMASSDRYCSAVVLSGLFLLEGVDRLRSAGILNEDYSPANPNVGRPFAHYRIKATDNFGGADIDFSSFALLGGSADAVESVRTETATEEKWYTVDGMAAPDTSAPGLYVGPAGKVIRK